MGISNAERGSRCLLRVTGRILSGVENDDGIGGDTGVQMIRELFEQSNPAAFKITWAIPAATQTGRMHQVVAVDD